MFIYMFYHNQYIDGCQYEENFPLSPSLYLSPFEKKCIIQTMKVAVTYEKETGNVFQHFGKTQYFKIYQIEDGKIVSSQVVDNGGNGHHDIPPYLKSLGVETLILGNRGQGAIEAIAASGLKEVPGITGSADDAAELFAKGELKPNFEAKCDHHGEHHK